MIVGSSRRNPSQQSVSGYINLYVPDSIEHIMFGHEIEMK